MRIGAWLRARIEAPGWPWGAALIAVLLGAPSLGLGLQADDHYLGLALTQPPADPEWARSPVDLFAFFRDEAAVRRARETGAVPWWTDLGLRLAFFRPLAGVTHWVDFRLWPQKAWLMHAQSLLWFGAAIAVAGFLYRRLVAPGWVAGLCALVFALDDAHASPAAWIANRNAVLGTLFGLGALAFHDRWRSDGFRPGMYLAPASLLLALLGGEIALATGAYLLAYALFLDRASWTERLASLLPCAAVGIAWTLVYRAQGYGASGSSVYVDPTGDPALFASALAERGPLLLMGQWALPSQLHGALSEDAGRGLWLFACGLAVVLAVLLWPLVRRDARARFFALGMLLSLVPSCATFPHDRLLFLAGFGGAGLVGQFLAGWWSGAGWVPGEKSWRAGAWVLSVLLVGFHLLVAPLGLLRATADLKAFGGLLDRAAQSLPGDDAVRTQQVVIVHTPSAFVSIYGLPARGLAGLAVPARLRVLGSSVHGLTVERSSPDALLLRPEGGFLSPRGRALPGGPPPPAFDFRYVLALLDSLYRESPTMPLGERIELSGVRVEVTTLTADGRPDSVRFTFDRSLEDPSYRWLRWEAGVYVPFPLPAVGASVSLPAPVVPLF